MAVRPSKKIRFGQLRKVMLDLGYQIRTVDQHYVAFVRPGRDLFVVLPDVPPEAEVRPIDLLSVQKTLMNDGLIEDEPQFMSLFLIKKGDRLIWTDPHTGSETEVIAASGETSDGMVIIKQKGFAFSPCAVDQLKPAGGAALHSL
jgi:hypothetical protein